MIFSIPLRSKQSTKDWDNVSHRLKVTIDSIFAQTKQDFLIVIAGHEKPDFLNQDYYKDIVFLTVPFPTPTEQSQFMADKLGKKRYTGSYINRLLKEDEFRIVMQMDADDIIHPEFIENISNIFHHDPSIDDVALMSGYAFDFKRQKLAFLNGVDKLFYRNCGSSFISKVFKRDLSENINEKSYFNSLVNHVSFPNIAREMVEKFLNLIIQE
ncbi:glycosyltransferase family A protein [Pasteurellaceae bacterium LIM206]|nr:glycosyltransferase family A protein [Pasteurellaceae bacterium LIM206]